MVGCRVGGIGGGIKSRKGLFQLWRRAKGMGVLANEPALCYLARGKYIFVKLKKKKTLSLRKTRRRRKKKFRKKKKKEEERKKRKRKDDTPILFVWIVLSWSPLAHPM